MKEESSNADLESKVEVPAPLPPWEVEGIMVDLVVYKEKKLICVMIPFTHMSTMSDLTAEKVGSFCSNVKFKLVQTVPPGWRVL